MLTLNAIKSTVEKISKKYDVKTVYLFGSYARGEATEKSDIDLRIEKGNLRGLVQLIKFENELKDALGTNVDVLTTSSLSNRFLSNIKNDEILIYG